MVKKVIATVFLFVLLAVAVVQAMEKDHSKETRIQESEAIPVEKIPGIGIGLKAPDFELKTLDGDTIKLSELKGEKVMLNFWATWCPPCKAEMPDMQKFYMEAGEDIKILAVNIDPEYDVAGFVKDMDLHFPVLLDEKDEVMDAYQILTIPTTFFIDEKGIIQNKYLGAMTLQQMKEYTDNL